MADLGASIKGLWIRSMEAIGNTASNIASNTRSKVDEMNLVNRRTEILKDFGNQAYALWQQGERFPEMLEIQLKELQKLDESLNDLRAERLAGVRVESGKTEAEEAPKDEAPASVEENEVQAEEDDDSAVPVIQVETAEEQGEESGNLSATIGNLFEKTPSVQEAADKVNGALDSLEEGLKGFSEQIDRSIDELAEQVEGKKPVDGE